MENPWKNLKKIGVGCQSPCALTLEEVGTRRDE